MPSSRAARGTRRTGGIASIRRNLDRRIVLSAIDPILAVTIAAEPWHQNDITP